MVLGLVRSINMYVLSVAEIAEKRGITMAQVAVAWSLSKSFMTAPIVGTTSLEKLKDVVGTYGFTKAITLTLTELFFSRGCQCQVD